MSEDQPVTKIETVEQKLARVNSLHENLRTQFESAQKAYKILFDSGDLFYRLSSIMGHPAQPDSEALQELLGEAASQYQKAWVDLESIANGGASLCDHITGLQNDINLEILSPPPP